MGKAFDEIYLKSNFHSWKIFCKVFEQSCLEASEVPQAAVQSATEKAFIYNKQSWIIHKKIISTRLSFTHAIRQLHRGVTLILVGLCYIEDFIHIFFCLPSLWLSYWIVCLFVCLSHSLFVICFYGQLTLVILDLNAFFPCMGEGVMYAESGSSRLHQTSWCSCSVEL